MSASYGTSSAEKAKVVAEPEVVVVQQQDVVKRAAKVKIQPPPPVVVGLISSLVSKVGKDDSQLRNEAKKLKLIQQEKEQAQQFKLRRQQQEEKELEEEKEIEAKDRSRCIEIEKSNQASKNMVVLQKRMEKSWCHKAKMRKMKRKQVRSEKEAEFQRTIDEFSSESSEGEAEEEDIDDSDKDKDKDEDYEVSPDDDLADEADEEAYQCLDEKLTLLTLFEADKSNSFGSSNGISSNTGNHERITEKIGTTLLPNTGKKGLKKAKNLSSFAPAASRSFRRGQVIMSEELNDRLENNTCCVLTKNEKRRINFAARDWNNFINDVNKIRTTNPENKHPLLVNNLRDIKNIKRYIQYKYTNVKIITVKNNVRILLKLEMMKDDNWRPTDVFNTELFDYFRAMTQEQKQNNGMQILHKEADKKALMVFDITRGIELIPDEDPLKSKFALIGLLGVYCGARAVTMANICLGDIVSFQEGCNSTNRSTEFSLKLRVVKGNSNSDLVLRFVDQFVYNIYGPTEVLPEELRKNICYWLKRYLYDTFNLLPGDFQNLSPLLSQLSLFQLDEAGLYNFFTHYMVSILGYPKGFFCFHSLRVGFLATVIENNAEAMSGRTSVSNAALTMASRIGGWNPLGENMMSYLKNSQLKNVPVNSLVLNRHINNTIQNTPETFHGLRDLPTIIQNSKYFSDMFHYRVRFALSLGYSSMILSSNVANKGLKSGMHVVNSKSFEELFREREKYIINDIIEQWYKNILLKDGEVALFLEDNIDYLSFKNRGALYLECVRFVGLCAVNNVNKKDINFYIRNIYEFAITSYADDYCKKYGGELNFIFYNYLEFSTDYTIGVSYSRAIRAYSRSAYLAIHNSNEKDTELLHQLTMKVFGGRRDYKYITREEKSKLYYYHIRYLKKNEYIVAIDDMAGILNELHNIGILNSKCIEIINNLSDDELKLNMIVNGQFTASSAAAIKAATKVKTKEKGRAAYIRNPKLRVNNEGVNAPQKRYSLIPSSPNPPSLHLLTLPYSIS